MTWRIHYEDGSMFTSDDGAPWDAPCHGVLAIWQPQPEAPLFNKDYYLWRMDYGCWIECDLVGLLDHLTVGCRQVHAVLLGRMVPTARYRDTLALLVEVNG